MPSGFRFFQCLLTVSLCLVVVGSLSACFGGKQAFSGSSAQPAKLLAPSSLAQHERGLLTIFVLELVQLERSGAFDTLYMEKTTPGFKAGLPRSTFLAMTSCLETHLGAFKSFDKESLQLKRLSLPEQGIQANYTLNRQEGAVGVQVNVLEAGLVYKIVGLQWHSNSRLFQQCVVNSLKPKPVELLPESTEVKAGLEPHEPKAENPQL